MACFNPIALKDKNKSPLLPASGRLVPCGKCLGCLSNQRSQWIFRLKKEEKRARSARFLTLTYNDENIKYTEYGEASLCKEDLQKYFKRVRKVEPRVRYFGVGEYGSKTDRPHYHGIVFNTSDPVLVNSWSVNGKELGFVEVDECNESTIAYVTKYIVNLEFDHYFKQKPFRIMSKGLGKDYLTPEMIEYHKQHLDNTVISEGGHKSVIPRYFKDKIYTKEEKKIIGELAREKANEGLPESLEDRYKYWHNMKEWYKINSSIKSKSNKL